MTNARRASSDAGPTPGSRGVGRALGWMCVATACAVAACGTDDSETQPTDVAPGDAGGTEVIIDLQEGFSDHSVVITVNGDEVFADERVTTAALIGLADSATVAVSADHAVVDVVVQPGGVEFTSRYELSDGRFIGLSLVGGRVESIQSTSAFGYG